MASAVAVTFTILIVAFMVGQYVSTQLPAQLTTAEFQHVLQVQDQLLALQADIVSEADHSSYDAQVTAPVTLNSAGVPPLGPPSTSSVYPEAQNLTSLTLSYKVGSLTYTEKVPGGFTTFLANRYFPQTTLDYEEGALIQYINGATPTMVQGPTISVSNTHATPTFNLTLIQPVFKGPTSALHVTGNGVAAVQANLLSAATYSVDTADGLVASQTFTILTPYPSAWISWFDEYSTVFTSGATDTGCTTVSGTSVCTVTATSVAQTISVTLATVSLQLD